MRARLVILIVLIGVLIAAVLAASAWNGRPQVISTQPAGGSLEVPIASQVEIEFSRAMVAESVLERLKFEPQVEGKFSWVGSRLIFTPSQAWPANTDIHVQLGAGAQAESWLTLPMQAQGWTFRTNQALLAYLWPADGPADIYALNPSTGAVLRLTQDMDVLEFTTSADGLVMYFSAGNEQGGADLYQLDRMRVPSASDASPRRLLSCGPAQCRQLAASADGTYLAYEYLTPTPRGDLRPAQIWLLRLAEREPSAVGAAGHESVQPGWSATGWLAYYDRTDRVYEAFHPQTQERAQVSNQTGQPGEWSLEGEYYLAPEITYRQADRFSETGASHLLRYSFNGGSPEDLSGDVDVEDVEGDYSPDGRAVAFSRKYLDEERWTFGRQVWVMNADGTNAHPITDEGDYNHYDLAWSRDSLRLAYVRFNQAKLSQPPELWVMDADGGSPLQLVIGGYAPLWIP